MENNWFKISCHCRARPVAFNRVRILEEHHVEEPMAQPLFGAYRPGDISGGPKVETKLKSTGEKVTLIHWGDAPKAETLLRAAPRGCLNKLKKK